MIKISKETSVALTYFASLQLSKKQKNWVLVVSSHSLLTYRQNKHISLLTASSTGRQQLFLLLPTATTTEWCSCIEVEKKDKEKRRRKKSLQLYHSFISLYLSIYSFYILSMNLWVISLSIYLWYLFFLSSKIEVKKTKWKFKY